MHYTITYNNKTMYLGQANQDKFVLTILKEKRNGYFLEIGSNHPVTINNTHVLETKFGWKGIMVEYEESYLPLYKIHRPNSVHIINDATKVDYKNLFETLNMPQHVDYLQIDLEANNGSTITTLQKLDNEIFNAYKFATVTFEHDVYHTNFGNTRIASRDIFKKRGYVCVFEDINNKDTAKNEVYPYEDWYVHPDLVDMDYVTRLMEINKTNYKSHPITGNTIYWDDIQY